MSLSGSIFIQICMVFLAKDAARKLPGDRAVTREDAEGVIGAEIRNSPNLTTYPGGVAASMATAAKHNQA